MSAINETTIPFRKKVLPIFLAVENRFVVHVTPNQLGTATKVFALTAITDI